MKNIINTIYYRILFSGVFGMMVLSSCTDAVEKTDLGKVTDDVIWGDVGFIKSYFDNTMRAIPGAESNLVANTEESYSFMATRIVYDNVNVAGDLSNEGVDRWKYNDMRKINRFLDHAGYDGFVSPQPMTSALSQTEKEDMIGQMLVLRAWLYFDMVRTYGGVPLLLHEQEATSNYEDLFTKRAKTSECIEQIVKDLTEATKLSGFPMKRSGDDGHITKSVAYALKGKVLLYYASPQFVKPRGGSQPTGTKAEAQRWTEAYNACNEAYTKLKEAGFGLYGEAGGDRKTVMDNYYKMLVTQKNNMEMIWVRKYSDMSKETSNGVDKTIRPWSSGSGNVSPTWEMSASFAMEDGTPFTTIQLDPTWDAGKGSGNLVHTGGVIDKAFWLDREPRFYAFIGYNSCEWPLIRSNQNAFASDVVGGKMQHEWFIYRTVNGAFAPFSNGYNQTNNYGEGLAIRKFVADDRNYEMPEGNSLMYCGTDWPLFRFAEVMLNLAEAAAKTNKEAEAYTMLDAIRKRAGINPANNYGLGRKMGDALILDILNERKIELFAESQRFYDVRRWRLYTGDLAGSKPLNGMQRHTIQSLMKDAGATASAATAVAAIQPILAAGGTETAAGITAYFNVFTQAIMLYDRQAFSYDPAKEDFLRITFSHRDKNPTLEQTIGWTDDKGAGTFNPYE